MAYDIHQATAREPQYGGGIVYEFWIDSVSDIEALPKPGKWATLTSIAFDISTFNIYVLRETGWVQAGGGT